jgi:hypothetical protein
MKISELIERLEHIRDYEGNLDVYMWDDGIAKMPNQVVKRETVNSNKKGCFIERFIDL